MEAFQGAFKTRSLRPFFFFFFAEDAFKATGRAIVRTDSGDNDIGAELAVFTQEFSRREKREIRKNDTIFTRSPPLNDDNFNRRRNACAAGTSTYVKYYRLGCFRVHVGRNGVQNYCCYYYCYARTRNPTSCVTNSRDRYRRDGDERAYSHSVDFRKSLTALFGANDSVRFENDSCRILHQKTLCGIVERSHFRSTKLCTACTVCFVGNLFFCTRTVTVPGVSETKFHAFVSSCSRCTTTDGPRARKEEKNISIRFRFYCTGGQVVLNCALFSVYYYFTSVLHTPNIL